jgi:type VI protein secretion system component Hcp
MNCSRALGWCVAFWLGAGCAFAQQLDGFVRFLPTTGGTLTGSSADQQFPGSSGWIPMSATDQSFHSVIATPPATSITITGSFQFSKVVDAASPVLLQISAKGTTLTVELALRRASLLTSYPAPFYSVTLSLAKVSSINWVYSPGETTVSEAIQLDYGTASMNFLTFAKDGTPTAQLNVNWDRIKSTWSDVTTTLLSGTKVTYQSPQSVMSGNSLQVRPGTLQAPAGLDHVALVSKGNYSGVISVDSLTGVVTLTGAQPVGGPYTIVVEAVDVTRASSQGSFELNVTALPSPPSATRDQVTRLFGATNAFPIASLLANDSPGAIFDSLISTSTALGGTVTVQGTDISYIPPNPDPATDDTFTYKVRDNYSQSATAIVIVGVELYPGRSIGNLAIHSSQSGTDLELKGLPAHKYQLQSAPTPVGPWSTVGEPLAGSPSTGLVNWLKLPATDTVFYRAYYVQ